MTFLANARRFIWRIAVPILLLTPISVAAGGPRRVLLLDSFERGAGANVFKAALVSELKTQSSEPLFFYELSLPSRLAGDPDESAFLNYLHSTFKDQQLDLIVTTAGPAAKFAQKNRDQFFPSTPLLFATVDERFLGKNVTPNSTAVALRVDPARMIDTILQAFPETKNVAVVIGSSPFEQFWREEFGHEFRRFDDRLTFTWFDNLPFTEMLNRSATLPAGSVVFFGLLIMDAKGIPHNADDVISEFHAKANAPIFALQSAQLGKGIVAALSTTPDDLTQKTASVALRLLKGEAPESIKVPPLISGPPLFDWRELRRWNIDENRLPPGSVIRFRTRTAWEQYKWYVIAGVALFVFEAILVVGLAVNLAKIKRVERSLRAAESQAQDFSKQLIQAQQAERSRLAESERRTLQLSRLASQLTLVEQNARKQLAGMLHDGLQQLLFSAGITLDEAMKTGSEEGQVELLQRARKDVKEAVEAARTLSVNLFPPVLHVGGLPAALTWLAKRTREQYNVVMNLTADRRANPEAGDVRILLFEGVRELVFNAVKHAQVDQVDVKLTAGPGDTIQIEVSDTGVGFDPATTLHHQDQHQVGLGLFSIQERLALLGGRLDVQSAPGKGARFILRVPRVVPSRPATDGAAARRHVARRKKHIVYDSGSGKSESLRILIADDHPVARAGLRELFGKARFQVVGEAANGVDAISQAMALQPDVIVMDISLPQINGIEATREIHRALPHIRIVGLSTHDDDNTQLSMREAGAGAYFAKNEGTERLLDYLLSLRAQAREAASGI
jgi:signal transduction histidine kinase/ABC-type uncharacterized transport system substrate-binding protein/ActR/RegA family two-component response regulator